MAYKTHAFTNGDTVYASDMNNIIAGIDELNIKVNNLEQSKIEILSVLGMRTSKVDGGITYTWNDDVCTVSGTATGLSFNNMIIMEPLVSPLLPGKTYHITLNKTDENIFVRVF
jgi:hypothetical protein